MQRMPGFIGGTFISRLNFYFSQGLCHVEDLSYLMSLVCTVRQTSFQGKAFSSIYLTGCLCLLMSPVCIAALPSGRSLCPASTK